MSKDERKIESILLQERWKLIQQGANRKVITIRKNEIFVGGLHHGKVIDQNFVKYGPQINITDNSSAPSAPAATDMEQNATTS